MKRMFAVTLLLAGVVGESLATDNTCAAAMPTRDQRGAVHKVEDARLDRLRCVEFVLVRSTKHAWGWVEWAQRGPWGNERFRLGVSAADAAQASTHLRAIRIEHAAPADALRLRVLLSTGPWALVSFTRRGWALRGTFEQGTAGALLTKLFRDVGLNAGLPPIDGNHPGVMLEAWQSAFTGQPRGG